MTTTVINNKYKTGAPEEVYIGRGSKWGNEWSHQRYTKAAHPSMSSVDEAVHCYTDWLLNSPQALHLRQAIMAGELKDKVLVCYCVNEKGEGVCHGQTLAALANAVEDGTIHQVADNMRATVAEDTTEYWGIRCKCHW